ncbi:MAG: hypothetical protein OIN87_04130 [Candidatus Methanoperedens sp.]|nr:hypothetical protein [Candidatus Methanoperedens sp.]
MDRILGSMIDDYTLYKIVEGMMIILSMILIYLGIQIALAWKFIQKKTARSDSILSEKDSFFRSSIFIFIAGFFILIHELFEGLEKDAPDFVTYEIFELIAISGFVLFLNEWNKIFKKMKNDQQDK